MPTADSAWIESRYPFEGESWPAFKDRIARAVQNVQNGHGGPVAVFTSATPIAITVSLALGLEDRGIIKLAGASFNTGLTLLRADDGGLALSQFNTTPHLADPALRTHV